MDNAQDATRPPKPVRTAAVEQDQTACQPTSAKNNASQRDQNTNATGWVTTQSVKKTQKVP